MKKLCALHLTFLFLLLTTNAYADSIFTSASGSMFGDSYSFLFTIEQDEAEASIFHATLQNTSSDSLAGALIDLLAFNLADPDPTLSTDFDIINITPDWQFVQTGNGGIQFDYTGVINAQSERIGPEESLLFDFDFDNDFALPENPYDLWLLAEETSGTGIGGGEISGQVAISFQSLGPPGEDGDGEGSDLLASNWRSVPVPEPATVLLIGLGLAGLIGIKRKVIL
jgi:hypothetical protein